MVGVLLLIVFVTSFGPQFTRPNQGGPVAPQEWVAFSADLRITMPNRPEAWGRHLQDEHGCRRQDTVHPDGSALTTISNFQTETSYRLYRGSWTSQPMRLGQMPRQPPRRQVTRKVEPIEGFEAYVSVMNVRSPRGDYTSESTLIPALNFFDAVTSSPTGERRTAVNIRVGPQPHDQFLPPPGAVVAEQPGFGGFMSFTAVVLRVTFQGQAPLEAQTMEETSYAVKTPSGIPLTLLTAITDSTKNIVRIRVLANATGRAGNVTGEVLDEISVALGETGQTTKLGENFSVTVTRVGRESR